MTTLTLKRHFPLPPEKVFAFITEPKNLPKWWGPEGMNLADFVLDFTRPGPWTSTYVNAEGGRHHVSGKVVTIDPPKSVELTWGWHDDSGKRGHESRVRFDLSAAPEGGTNFVLTHADLPSDESAANHDKGWTSILRELERTITAN